MGFLDRFKAGFGMGEPGSGLHLSAVEKRLRSELSERDGRLVRCALLFSGTVQGVGFRWTNQALARKHGLSGWVRNLDDGRVSMEIQGPASDIAGHLDRVHAYYQRFGNRVVLDEARILDTVSEDDFAVRV